MSEGGRSGGGKHRSAALTRRQEAKAECAAAFEKAKETAQGPQIREANEWFAVCAQPSCSRPLRKKCAAVHARIAAILPTVVPVVTDADGANVRDVVVRMDGESLTSNLDGSAIVIDPGNHQFTFARDGEVFATRRLDVEKGEQHKLISATFQPRKREEVDAAPAAVAVERTPAPRKISLAKAAEEVAESESAREAAAEEEAAPRLVKRERSRREGEDADEAKGAPWSAYALAGVGVLGVAGYWTFNLKGSADNDALVALCAPRCMPTSVRHVRNLYLAADISLGIGLAALAGSTYLFFRSPDNAEEESPRSRRSHISQIGVAPTGSGALATVGGTF